MTAAGPIAGAMPVIDIDAVGEDGLTALMRATANGRHREVEALIRRGADVHVVSAGDTALIRAVQEGHLEIVETLIKAYAMNRQGQTALDIAEGLSDRNEKKTKIIRLLEETNVKWLQGRRRLVVDLMMSAGFVRV